MILKSDCTEVTWRALKIPVPGPDPKLNKTTFLGVDPDTGHLFNSPCGSNVQAELTVPELEERWLKTEKRG